MARLTHEQLIEKFGRGMPDTSGQCILLNERYNAISIDLQEAGADNLSPKAIHTLILELIAIYRQMEVLHCPLPPLP